MPSKWLGSYDFILNFKIVEPLWDLLMSLHCKQKTVALLMISSVAYDKPWSIRPNDKKKRFEICVTILFVQSNLVIRNVLIRNKLALRNHFQWPIENLLHRDKEHLALRYNFRVTKKFLNTKFDCIFKMHPNALGGIASTAQVLQSLWNWKSFSVLFFPPSTVLGWFSDNKTKSKARF